MHGEMAWLGRDEVRRVRERLDGDGILPGAKSVVCVARRYGPVAPGSKGSASGKALEKGSASANALGKGDESANGEVSGAGGGMSIARYARGRDYHGFLRRRLRRLAAFVRSLGEAPGGAPVIARPLCDEEPVLERAWARRAGLGFIGKNGMLIVPGIGSMVLLGEVVTTLELEQDEAAALPGAAAGLDSATERCGACTRCLDACPTSAFVAPFVLDPRRCVSYLTIEHRSAVSVELRPGVSDHLFGCDECQTVCPFNAGAGPRAELDTRDGEPFEPLERWSRTRLEDWLLCDLETWRVLVQGSPLKRAGRGGIARNAAIALGNRGDPRALPALEAAAGTHDEPMVREAAAWAIEQITRRSE